jgi:hypothetical protein
LPNAALRCFTSGTCGLLLLLAAPLNARASGSGPGTLPDAPAPQQSQADRQVQQTAAHDAAQNPTPDTHVPVTAARPNNPAAVAKRRFSDVVNPGEKIPRLTVRDKLLFPVHEEFSWTTPIPVLYDAAYGNLTNADPKYGTNAEAFGHRVEAAAIRQATTRALADGIMPALFHEDPRYYRQAYGSYPSRTFHAIRRIWVSQRDSGTRTFNFSDIVGRGVGAGLTATYYPSRSADAEVVFTTWGLSLVALGGGNLFEEFWPDIRHKLFHGPQN